MTVKELIEELSKFNEKMDVFIEDADTGKILDVLVIKKTNLIKNGVKMSGDYLNTRGYDD